MSPSLSHQPLLRVLLRVASCGFVWLRVASCGFVEEILFLEHLVALALGGRTIEENLWLACRPCNAAKQDRIEAIDPLTQQLVPLFNPRTQGWDEHFRWNKDHTEIEGLTPEGRATVPALRLNDPIRVRARRLWVNAGWWPPSD